MATRSMSVTLPNDSATWTSKDLDFLPASRAQGPVLCPQPLYQEDMYQFSVFQVLCKLLTYEKVRNIYVLKHMVFQ